MLDGTNADHPLVERDGTKDWLTVFLCGDVMIGRGIDQALPHPGDPQLHERWVRDARGYIELAERRNGPIARPMDFATPWGDALNVLERMAPDARVLNLETSLTQRGGPWPGKGIHYRMHPDNVRCLTSIRPDCCVLANNHVLDWGHEGLVDTLATLEHAGLPYAGAGRNDRAAAEPAVIPLDGDRRLLVVACGHASSGIPTEWAAGADRAGVNFLPDLSPDTADRVASLIRRARRPGDRVLVSIHWGSNWGYQVPKDQRRFARALIDLAAVDLIHGHSSHHPRPCEVYRGKLILYGCGDFLNDYEGISGHEEFRGDLALMYFAALDADTGHLHRLDLVPTRTRRFRVELASDSEATWLRETLDREGASFGSRIDAGRSGRLTLRWHEGAARRDAG